MVGLARAATEPRGEWKPSEGCKPAQRLFTVDEYLRLGEVGILHEDDPVELIEGELLLMASQGTRHVGCIAWLDDYFHAHLAGRVIVIVQSSVRLRPFTMPEPDVVLLRYRRDFYRTRHAEPEDVFLVIEVADTTLPYDRDVKRDLYATAGIREYWIVDLSGEQVLVYRGLQNGRYTELSAAGRSGTVAPLAFPELVIAVDEILG